MANPLVKDKTGRYSVAVFENAGHKNLQIQVGYKPKGSDQWKNKDISIEVKDWNKVKDLVEQTLAKLEKE